MGTGMGLRQPLPATVELEIAADDDGRVRGNDGGDGWSDG